MSHKKLTAAQRQQISDRMKQRWAERRKANGGMQVVAKSDPLPAIQQALLALQQERDKITSVIEQITRLAA